MTNKWKLAGALALGIFAFIGNANAQGAFPEKAITLIVPFAPGGGSDILGRLVGQKMSEFLGQEVIVDNKPGAAGTLGSDVVVRSKEDGYTLLLINTIAHSAASVITPDVAYDPAKSFTAVGAIGDTQYLLIDNPSFADNYQDAIAKIKADPDKYNFASSGIGSAPHLVMELFMKEAGIQLHHIPYGGSGPALNDIVAGTIPLIFENVAAIELIKAGKLKALATTGETRQEVFPDVPTFKELGVDQFDIAAHWGLIAPAGVPVDAIAVLNDALNKALEDEALIQALAAQSIQAKPGTAEAYNDLMSEEAVRWRGVAETAELIAK